MKTWKQRTFSPWAFAAIVVIFVFGFAFTGCGDKDDGGGSVAVTGITLDTNTLSLTVGSSATLSATVTPSNATSPTVTWTSSNVNRATVVNGTVTAKATGAVTITATAGDKTATCNVTVTAAIAVSNITLDKSTLDMEEGDEANLIVTISPSTASNKAVTWSSSNEDMVTVSATSATGATVTAVAEGTAIITVSSDADGSKKATCTVTVTPYDPGAIRPTGITMGKGATTLEVGQTETLSYTIAPPDATLTNVNWASSDPAKASVVNGLVTALAEGQTTITVTTQSGNHQSFCTVTVTAATADPTKVASVELNKNELTLLVGEAETLTVTVLPSTATNRSVTWSTSDSTKANVNSTTGRVTAVGVGEATITARSNADNTKFDICTVTVNPVPVTGVTVAPTALTLTTGSTRTLIATVLPNNATNKAVIWSSGDDDVATVDQSGKVTAIAEVGEDEAPTAVITVATVDGDFKAYCEVTVIDGVPEIGGFVWMPPGTFQMGSPSNETGRYSDETRHSVTLTNGFYMLEETVSQGLFGDVMAVPIGGEWYGYYPSYFDWEVNPAHPEWAPYWSIWPADSMTWFEAVEFCNKLSEELGLTPAYTIHNRMPAADEEWPYPFDGVDWDAGSLVTTVTCDWDATGFRLPTEAEWEYACRAGTTTAYNIPNGRGYGSNTITLDYANYSDSNTQQWYGVTFPAGEFEPNQWGLYDMHGTLMEWCWDAWAWDDYGNASQTDPTGPDLTGIFARIMRGGSYQHPNRMVRSAYRDADYPFNDGMYVFDDDDNLVDWIAMYGFRFVVPYSAELIAALDEPSGKRVSKSIQQSKIARQELRIQGIPQGITKGMQKGIPQSITKSITKGIQKGMKGKRQIIPQGIPKGIKKVLPQNIQILDKKLEVSPVKPQALRRKSVFE
jgi:uncharacterized protein YjdB/formylglycine-generating enzyme required for sulfatase activity